MNQLQNGQIENIITHEMRISPSGQHTRSVQNMQKYYNSTPNALRTPNAVANLKMIDPMNYQDIHITSEELRNKKQMHNTADDKEFIMPDFKTPHAAVRNDHQLDQNRYRRHLKHQAAYDKNRRILDDWQNAQSYDSLNNKIWNTVNSVDIISSNKNEQRVSERVGREGLPPLPNYDYRQSKDLAKTLNSNINTITNSNSRMKLNLNGIQSYQNLSSPLNVDKTKVREGLDQSPYAYDMLSGAVKTYKI